MLPRDGTNFSTEYYKQSVHEYSRTDEHIRRVIEQVITQAQREDLMDELETPLKGFKRTNKTCYSAMDIMKDLLDQVNREKDIPKGMLGRWNRLFSDNPDFTIEMEEERLPNPVFNKLFTQ